MNPNTAQFVTNWISSPGATISDILAERNCSIASFAAATHRTPQEVAQLLMGASKLTPDWADQLTSILGASQNFWLKREAQYRDDIARLSANDRAAMKTWLDSLPLKDMIGYHWIDGGDTSEQLVHNALAFFGVPSIEAWRRTYENLFKLAAYRRSFAYSNRLGSEVAWLRQAEIQARAIDCAQWNADAFLEVLPQLRKLTREPDPVTFLPRLRSLCASAGVAAVVTRAPTGCRASGATKFVSEGKAMLLVSFRYLSDDQFWFTVFHEAAHLVLHAVDETFLEGCDFNVDEVEKEADSFARLQLFPGVEYDALSALPLNKFSIARFARHLGVSPGIVVGQLQQMGRVPYKHFNYMKARYTWTD